MGSSEPLTCDFGISRISDEIDENVTFKMIASEGNARHGVPQPIETNSVSATRRSDAYPFTILMLESVTEGVPFFHLHHNAEVVHVRVGMAECPP